MALASTLPHFFNWLYLFVPFPYQKFLTRSFQELLSRSCQETNARNMPDFAPKILYDLRNDFRKNDLAWFDMILHPRSYMIFARMILHDWTWFCKILPCFTLLCINFEGSSSITIIFHKNEVLMNNKSQCVCV